jgi:hypothetical protein
MRASGPSASVGPAKSNIPNYFRSFPLRRNWLRFSSPPQRLPQPQKHGVLVGGHRPLPSQLSSPKIPVTSTENISRARILPKPFDLPEWEDFTLHGARGGACHPESNQASAGRRLSLVALGMVCQGGEALGVALPHPVFPHRRSNHTMALTSALRSTHVVSGK